MNINVLDLILTLAVIIPGIIAGLRKGFISQIVAIAAIFVGVMLSTKFAAAAGEWIARYVSLHENVIRILSFAGIFLGVYFLFCLLGKLIEKVFKDVAGGGLNKVLGVIFGLAKYAFFASLLIFVFNGLNDKLFLVEKAHLDESVLYGFLLRFSDTVFPFLRDLVSSLPAL